MDCHRGGDARVDPYPDLQREPLDGQRLPSLQDLWGCVADEREKVRLPASDPYAVIAGEPLIRLDTQRVPLLARHSESALLQFQREQDWLNGQRQSALQHDESIKTGHALRLPRQPES